MKHIEISLMENGELSIDGQTRPGGKAVILIFVSLKMANG